MNNQRLIAYVVLGLGLLALLNRLTDGASWLWLALVAVAFLGVYSRQKSYSWLVAGCVLTGLAVGQLLEPLGTAALFISLAVGLVVLDRLEPRKERWPLQVAGALTAVGLVVGLSNSGILTPLWLALVISAVGLVMVIRSYQDGGWVKVPNQAPVKERLDEGVSDKGISQVAPSIRETVQTISETSESAPSVNSATAVTSAASQSTAEQAKAEAGEASVESGSSEPDSSETGSPELRAKLERWRRDTAKEEDRAAYLILTNETLANIVKARPQTLEELETIKGIGPVKLERYGKAIIELVKADS